MNAETHTQPRDASLFDKFLRALPAVQWALWIVLCGGGGVLFFRDGVSSQAAQISEIRQKQQQTETRISELKAQRDKQFDEFRGEMVTKQSLQDKFETLLKLQELTREDLKQLRESIERQSPRTVP